MMNGMRNMATEPRILEGYAAMFNLSTTIYGDGPQPFTESIKPGAFAAVLASKKLETAFTRDHDVGRIIGRAGKNLRLEEDKFGLKFRLELPKTELASETRELVRGGIVTGMSFAFWLGSDEWQMPPEGLPSSPRKRERLPHRTITGVARLMDCSACTWAAYPQPQIVVGRYDEPMLPRRRGPAPKDYLRSRGTPEFAKTLKGTLKRKRLERGCGHTLDGH